MTKEWGFAETRKRHERQRVRRLPRRAPWWFWPLVFAVLLLLITGGMRALSQSSDWSLSSSSDDLMTWETLSGKFYQGLDRQSMLLTQALEELETSKASSLKSMFLLEQSLQANSSLRTYNKQIGQRMQERDEDLALAYGEIGRLEKRALRLTIWIIVLAAALAVIIILIFYLRKRGSLWNFRFY